jgi:hypothetical protein
MRPVTAAPNSEDIPMKRDLYSQVSARIVTELEQGGSALGQAVERDTRHEYPVQCSDQSPLQRL